MNDELRLPQGDEVHSIFIRDGQQWDSQKRACYKCANFKSNMPLQGLCDLLPKVLIVSSDMSLGDTCRKFSLRPDAKKEGPNDDNYTK